MRVLHVVHRLAHGGGERQLVDMVKLMSNKRFQHAVCTLYRGCGLEPEIAQCDVPLLPLNLGGRQHLGKVIYKLHGLIESMNISILHLWMIDAVILGRIAHWITLKSGGRCALVISPQGSDYAPEVLASGEQESRLEFLAKKSFDRITRLLAPQTQIACSEYEKSTYLECLKVNPREIKVVHNTTDLSDGYQCLSEAEQVAYQSELGEEGHPKVICVSRLIKRKGQEVLLRALLEVAKRFGDVKLWLVGEGEHRQALEQLCTTMGLARHVRFLGLRSDVKRLLQMADIFVFPTLHEPFGIVLAEAMAARLPCIASRTGAIPEIIEEGVSGLTFTPGSSEELAHCIIQLADEPELCKLMGQRGRQIAEARFDARKAAAAYEQIYLEAYARQVLAR